ncbi:MAG: hypothetical protein QXX52_08150 [Ignisphaera sp.]
MHQQGSASDTNNDPSDPYSLLSVIAEIKLLKTKISELENRIESLEMNIAMLKDTNDKWFKIIVILLSILGAIIGVKVSFP